MVEKINSDTNSKTIIVKSELNACDQISPEATASVFSRWTYSWMNPVFLKGWKNPLELKDIWKLGPEWEVQKLEAKLTNAWNQHLESVKGTGTPPSLITATWNALFRELFPYGVLRFFSDLCTVAAPYMIKFVVDYLARSKAALALGTTLPSLGEGFGLIVGLFLLLITATITQNYYFQLAMLSGMSIRSAFVAMIYKKSTKLSSGARQKFNSGQVTNLVSTDVNRLETFFSYMHVIWTAPIQILIITALLIVLIGPAALAGIGLLILLGPLQGRLMRVLGQIRRTVAPLTDSRVKLTQEVFSGIRVIKFFAWETPFLEQIEDLRKKELAQILHRALLNAGVTTLAFAVPILSAAIAFVIYGATNPLDPGRVFAALALFAQLRFPLMFLPMIISGYADVKVAMTRMEALLLAPELVDQPPVVEDPEFAVKIENADFVWDAPPEDTVKTEKTDKNAKKEKEIETPAKEVDESAQDEKSTGQASTIVEEVKSDSGKLININLSIPKGKLVAIVGTVGSGKSSLLNGMVGEMRKIQGVVQFSGSTGYAPQQAWIQNATLKENILFGLPYDKERYLSALHHCALEKDLEVLPDADETEIGEKGINLSGGQKQRVNLARMVYFNSDIVLMDDPLSAVDAHVGKFLFESCIKEALAGKTRILVTHQLHFLPQVDYVVVMKNGQIAEQGTYETLLADGAEFANLMKNYGGVEDDTKVEQEEVDDQIDSKKEISRNHAARIGDALEKKNANKDVHQLIQKEERAIGTVRRNIWLSYLNAAGGVWFVATMVLILVFIQGTRVGNDFWLVTWSNNAIPSFSQGMYIGIYMAWGVAQTIATYVFGIYFAFTGTRAARNMHAAAISNIIRAPTRFFDSTPLGRIINRFSKDQDSMDTTLMDSIRMFANTLSSSIAIFVLIIYATPLFVVPLVPIMTIYYFIQLIYRATSRELKRLDSISRSPLYGHIGETLNGLPTIRAYREVDRFIRTNNSMIDKNNAPNFLLLTAARWLALRLETLGALMVFFAGTFGIIARTNESFSAALLGLSLSYALQVTGTLNWCIRQYTDTEVAMNAVERLEHYGKVVQQEAPAVIEGKRTPSGWPVSGNISFEAVDMKYAPDLPLVLKGISFEIKDGEKIGVVGRTGSGKSSLMQALFRMVEPSSGKITVDGLNIQEIGLTDLRKGLDIIPQDPVLFSGTFRRNLDPFGQFTDAEIWDALERANIKGRVVDSEGGLEGPVQEGGENLSVGQRQLLCLARAMLRKPKILIMDEATANVDFETDAIIQKCLRQDFAQSTVLTIAHRLNTIMDYDRVLVLGAGEILEFDTPKTLIQNKDGVFHGMVQETGKQNMDIFLRGFGLI